MINWRSQIDRDIYDRILIPVLREEPTTVFVGAGLSKHAGYPLVDELINSLHIRAQEHIGRELILAGDWKQKAERCKSELGKDNFNQILIDIFNPDNAKLNFTSVHTHLVKIPFKSFITTNYDACIELAFRVDGKNRQPLYYPNLNASELSNNSIQHIHGYIDPENPHSTIGSIILTTDDFEQAYRDKPGSVKRFLIDLFSDQNVIFLGFNMSDKTLTDEILSSVKEATEDKQKIATSRRLPPITEKRHFAILENTINLDDGDTRTISDQEKERLIRDQDTKLYSLGVYTIRYNIDSYNYHKSVENIITDMKSLTSSIGAKGSEAGDII
jgi:hypothetical protein